MIFSNIVKKEQIEKGWSGDKKYKVVTTDEKTYFLRITPKSKVSFCREIFDLQLRLCVLGIPMPKPYEIDECSEGIYTIYQYLDGVDAEDKIKSLPESEQYAYGKTAGEILKVIHTVPAPDNAQNWESRFNAKINRKIKLYEDCPIKFKGAQFTIDYINANRQLLKERPQCFQHGDYHVGNMMIEHDKLFVIDFDRLDYGDPWEEFNRIVWCAQASPKFACGMVDGYFDGQVPFLFWQLLALYISSNTLSSIPWAIPFGQKEINVMINQAKEVLSWYDDMKNPIPTWYQP
ncbi:MAG: phosphotransferase [Clostridia bacterium]|nr:phosphotransferase [Clostridia bacterium]